MRSFFLLWEHRLPRFPLMLALIAALTGCGQPSQLAVSDGWVRLAAAPGRPAAAYFTLTGGATDATLVGVTSPAAGRSELHETTAGSGGVTTMAPVGQVALPAGGKVTFAPGGKHVMLFDVRPGVKPGGTIPLAFTFADGRKLTYDAKAIAAGDPPPGA